MIASALRPLVSRKVAIGGGTVAAIRAMASSEMTPGPLGMAGDEAEGRCPVGNGHRCLGGRLDATDFDSWAHWEA
jgi:hypothetical protein